jgi:hypothetical protein
MDGGITEREPIMTPKQFAAAGRALFGPLYKTPLARALGNEPRTVRRWADGSFPIADGVRDDLIRLLTARGIEIEEVLGNLEQGQ